MTVYLSLTEIKRFRMCNQTETMDLHLYASSLKLPLARALALVPVQIEMYSACTFNTSQVQVPGNPCLNIRDHKKKIIYVNYSPLL